MENKHFLFVPNNKPGLHHPFYHHHHHDNCNNHHHHHHYICCDDYHHLCCHNYFVRHCPQNCHHLKERCCHPTHHLVTFTGADWSPQLKQSSGEISWSLLDQLQCDTSWVGSSDIDFRYKIQCRIQQYWNWKQNYLFCLNSNFQYKNGISEIPKLFFTHTVQFWVLLLNTSGVDSLVRVLNFWLNQKFEWEDAPSRIPRSINFVFGVASHEIVN